MVVRLTILIKKLDSISHEEFHKYWSKEHPKIWLSVKVVQDKIIKYSQFHVDNATSSALKEHGLPISEFDGGVEMWAEKMDDFMEVFQDEEYNQIVVPDEKSFLKRDEGLMMIGHDEPKWVDGKKVEGSF